MIAYCRKSNGLYKTFFGLSSSKTPIEIKEKTDKKKELLKEKDLEEKLSKSRNRLLKEADELALRAVKENEISK